MRSLIKKKIHKTVILRSSSERYGSKKLMGKMICEVALWLQSCLVCFNIIIVFGSTVALTDPQ